MCRGFRISAITSHILWLERLHQWWRPGTKYIICRECSALLSIISADCFTSPTNYQYMYNSTIYPSRVQATRSMRADVLWRLGASGAGVRIAILDRGVASSRVDAFGRVRIRERLNFCPVVSLDDGMWIQFCVHWQSDNYYLWLVIKAHHSLSTHNSLNCIIVYIYMETITIAKFCTRFLNWTQYIFHLMSN